MGRYAFRSKYNQREKNAAWRGGLYRRADGYIDVRLEDGYQKEHIVVAERVLGKSLPTGAVVHHINEDRSDNRPGNLVICQDTAYHSLLHRRLRALRESGHVDWLKCVRCKKWSPPTDEDLWSFRDSTSNARHYYHRACERLRRRARLSAEQ
jgi:hypothetical protein